MKRLLPVLIVLIILFALGAILPKFGTAAVTASVAVAPEVIFHIGSFPVSNTIFTSWIVTILILLFAFFATRRLSLVPQGLQNVFEIAIELWDTLGRNVAGERNKMFFPFVMTIFTFVLFSNYLGLLPGFGPIGIIALKEGEHAPEGIVTFDLPFGLDKVLGEHPALQTSNHQNPHEANPTTESAAPLLAPFVRSPSTDINTTLALALISMVTAQIFGMKVVGPLKYWTKFFNLGKVGQFFVLLFKGKLRFGLLAYGLIDFFVGLLEFISEIVKVISFTFRLFGNIFAGEVVLLIMAFLGSAFYFFGMPLIFYALELFVGFMQAFVFGILTLVFMTIATTAHSAEEHH